MNGLSHVAEVLAVVLAIAASAELRAALPDFTADLNRRIAEVSAKGGGRVAVPAGRHESGTIRMESNVELCLDEGAEIVGVADHMAYPIYTNGATVSQKNQEGWCALVYAENATNITLSGKGTIDGQGALQTARTEADGDLDCRARGILFVSCRDVTVRDVRLRNAGMWTQHYFDCEDVLVENVEVFSRANHNNDGIDIDSCRRVTVRNCTIDSGDDAVVVKTTSCRPCEDVLVEKCALSSQATGFKIGTETVGDIRRIKARDLRVFPSSVKTSFSHSKGRFRGIAAIAIFSADGAEVSDVDLDGVQASGQDCGFFIRVCDRCRPVAADGKKRAPGSIRRVRIANFKSVDTGNLGSSVISYERGRIRSVALEHVSIHAIGGVGDGDYTPVEEFRTWSNAYPSPLLLGRVPAKGVFAYGVDDADVTMEAFEFTSTEEDVRPLRVTMRAAVKGMIERHRHLPGSRALKLGSKSAPYAVIGLDRGAYRCDLVGKERKFSSRYALVSALADEAYRNGWAGICLPARENAGDPVGADREMVQVLHDCGFYAAVWSRGEVSEDYCRAIDADGCVVLNENCGSTDGFPCVEKENADD